MQQSQQRTGRAALPRRVNKELGREPIRFPISPDDGLSLGEVHF